MKRGLESMMALSLATSVFQFSVCPTPSNQTGYPKRRMIDIVGGFQLNIQPIIYAINQFKKYNHVDINKLYEKENKYPLKFTILNLDTRNYLELALKFD